MSIENYLNSPYKIIHYKTVTSTNDLAKEMAKNGENDLCVIIADCQTAGKGRLSRSFYSPDKSGIYMSIILRPSLKIEDTVLITTAAAVAVSRAIEKVCNASPLIKWVNDLYLNGKKICGILTESAVNPKTAETDYAVLGIGVNLYETEFPQEIKDIAGGIYKSAIDTDTKQRLIAEILNEFYEIYPVITDRKFMDEYKCRSLVLGKKVFFDKDGQRLFGTAQALDDTARLTVSLENGEKCILSSGEVSIKLA